MHAFSCFFLWSGLIGVVLISGRLECDEQDSETPGLSQLRPTVVLGKTPYQFITSLILIFKKSFEHFAALSRGALFASQGAEAYSQPWTNSLIGSALALAMAQIRSV